MKCYRHGCEGTGLATEIPGYKNGHQCNICGASWAYAPAISPKPEPVAHLATSRELTQEQKIMQTIVKQGRALKW